MANIIKVLPVILAGGNGTRLWPLSRKQYPKQFLKVNNSHDTLLQGTLKRLNGVPNMLPPIIICNEEHRFITAEQLREIGIEKYKIFLEPIGKNTAPAAAIASFLALEDNKDQVILILAADHIINSHKEFEDSLNKAIELCLSDKLVTFGITPTEASTGYGYIEKGNNINEGYNVKSFTEKPEYDVAVQYLKSGRYLWNSGMFMFKAINYLSELEKYATDIYQQCMKISASILQSDKFISFDKQVFNDCPSNSIDYAVMEHTNQAAVIELETEWSDIGSWASLWDISPKDSKNNVLIGDVINIESENCYVASEDRLVTLLNVNNLIIIDTKDALLISDKNSSEEIKKVVTKLESYNRKEHIRHKVTHRPWGVFDSIDNGDRYQVKRITVKPGGKLSLQLHYHRAEHWIVVRGTARVVNGEDSFLLSENQSTYIPAGVVHTLENPGKIPLEIIEVQSGTYLGEDDIVRLDDLYGRN